MQQNECNKDINATTVAANLKNNMVGQCQKFFNIKIIIQVEVDKQGYYDEFLNDSGTV